MSKQTDYMDLAMKSAGITSDYALAKRIGVTRQYVSMLRRERRPVSEEIAEALGDVIGVAGIVIYAEVQAERAKTKEKRRFWREAVAAVSAGCLVVALLIPPDAAARTLYIMLSRTRRRLALRFSDLALCRYVPA